MFSYGYTHCVTHNDLINWVSKNSWKMLLSWFSLAKKQIPCPRAVICNNCEKHSLIGEIFNAGDNIDDQEDYGFSGSYFKISPTVIDDHTKKKFLNMQLGNLRPQINIENNDNQYYERYQINMIGDNESDERDHIDEKEGRNIEYRYIILEAAKIEFAEKIDYLEK